MLPEHYLKLMSKSDRAKLGKAGILSSEANEVHDLRNERELQKLIRNELLRRKIPHSYSATNKRTTNTIGWPDFTFCVKGKFCYIECKFGKGKLSEEQFKVLEALRINGATGLLATDFKTAKEFIDWLTDENF